MGVNCSSNNGLHVCNNGHTLFCATATGYTDSTNNGPLRPRLSFCKALLQTHIYTMSAAQIPAQAQVDAVIPPGGAVSWCTVSKNDAVIPPGGAVSWCTIA